MREFAGNVNKEVTEKVTVEFRRMLDAALGNAKVEEHPVS
jgi:hypothetical protein